jgi:hypothetical protein
MILFFTNFFFAVLFTVLAVDELRGKGRTGAVMFYLMIAGMSWFSCAVAVMAIDAEPVAVQKFLAI